MNKLGTLDWIALILVIIGGLNWGLVGVANYDLVASLFKAGSTLSMVIYDLVGLSAIWLLIISPKLARK